MKKLKDPQQSIARSLENVNSLGEKLEPILFQLPPFWQVNKERLVSFLNVLPAAYQHTFEFRHPSWYASNVMDLLRQFNVAFCIYELDQHLSPMEVTADFVYVRLHGSEGKYAGSYQDDTLWWWAGNCLEWWQQGKQVYLYFDNDQYGYAAFNAQRLQELVQQQVSTSGD